MYKFLANFRVLISTTAIVALSHGAAHAQEEPPAPSTEAAGVGDTIVVIGSQI